MNGKSILIVDDEAPIREMIVVALEMAGYDCLEAENTQQAHALIIDRKPDLILLDWMPPGTSGIELARRLKRDELTADTPIIMLTAKGEEDNKIQGLEVGADDYITKPFSPRELVARLKAVLRRATPVDSEAPIEIGGLLLDPVSHRVTIDGKPAEMGPTEYRLLQFFMTHRTRSTPAASCSIRSGAAMSTSRSAPWTYTSAGCARPRRGLREPRCRPYAAPAIVSPARAERPALACVPNRAPSRSLRSTSLESGLARSPRSPPAAAAGGCLLLGLISGEYAWALVLGLSGYLIWTLRQLLRLQRWLHRSDPDEPPPDSAGIWGDVFDNLYQLQRRDLRLRGELQGIIDRAQESTAALKRCGDHARQRWQPEWWNPAANRLLGLKKPQDAGHPIGNLVRHPAFASTSTAATTTSRWSWPRRWTIASACSSTSPATAIASTCCWSAMSPGCISWSRCARISLPTSP